MIYIAPNATIEQKVKLGKDTNIWYHTTIRQGSGTISIGDYTNVQDNCVIHVEKDHALTIGDYVTIGHGAIVHCKSVGNRTLIGMGAILLNGAQIGNECIIGAGTLITQGMIIPDHSVVVGNPGRIVRQIKNEEIESNLQNALHYVELAIEELESKGQGGCNNEL